MPSQPGEESRGYEIPRHQKIHILPRVRPTSLTFALPSSVRSDRDPPSIPLSVRRLARARRVVPTPLARTRRDVDNPGHPVLEEEPRRAIDFGLRAASRHRRSPLAPRRGCCLGRYGAPRARGKQAGPRRAWETRAKRVNARTRTTGAIAETGRPEGESQGVRASVPVGRPAELCSREAGRGRFFFSWCLAAESWRVNRATCRAGRRWWSLGLWGSGGASREVRPS